MKKKILLCLIVLITVSSHAQQQFTHTASKENIVCNYDCTLLDVPGLNNNPEAILLVTSISGKGQALTPHLTGVYYFKNRWHIFTLDGKPIPIGLTFNVEYVASPDKNHFQYAIRRGNIQKDGTAFIDHPALNNNPTAKFNSLLSWNPETGGAVTNKNEATVQYNTDAGKWFVGNINKNSLFPRVVYNIIIADGGNAKTSPGTSNAAQIKEVTVSPNPAAVAGTIANMYMTVWADGIKLPGDKMGSAHSDQTQIFGLEMGATSPTTLTSGQLSSGKRIYEPITIKFHSGWPVAIPLLNAFVNSQNMAFTLDAFSNEANNASASGLLKLNYSIKLSGARIISFKQSYEEANLHIGTGAYKKVYDEIKIMFAKIEYANSGGATAADNL